jgi:acyl-CoA synthetase (AMP-forming)/AMP-acid ligase II
MQYVVADAKPVLLFAMPQFDGRDFGEEVSSLASENPSIRAVVAVGGSLAGSIGWEQFLEEGKALASERLGQAAAKAQPDDPVCLIYTSGTTGRPKGALISQSRLLHNCKVMAATIDVRPVRLANVYPVDHVAGIQGPYLMLLTAGSYFLQQRYSPQAVLEMIQREHINVWFAEVPQLLLALPHLDRFDLSSLKVVHYAGRPPLELLRQLDQLGIALNTGYGMTETSNAVFFTDRSATIEALARHNVGRPIDGVEVRLLDDHGAEVTGIGEGRCEIRSDYLLLDYLNRPEAVEAARTPDGWLRTGDLLRRVGDGSYEFVGRSDDTYKSGGYNVYPREVEIALEEHPDVAGVIVVGAPDPLFGATGHAFVAERSRTGLTVEALDQHCRHRLANYKIPRRYTILPELPLLRNGKFDRARLKAVAIEAASSASGQP